MKKELQGLYDLCISNGISESELKPYFATIESNLKTKRYGLVWEEQLEDIANDLKNKFPILVERKDLSINADPNGLTNCLIEGDNYESLTFLKNSGVKVDCIYIDPPYNTGNKDFVYNDKYIDTEDTWRHSSWLSFMNKRLKLAKELLTEDGVIFISIDDNEQAQLKLLCDSVFGENNFISMLLWKNNPRGRTTAKFIGKTTEIIYFYCKDITKFNINKKEIIDDSKMEKYKFQDYLGKYKKGYPLHNGTKDFHINNRPNLAYTVYYNPETGHAYTVDEKENNSENLYFLDITKKITPDGYHRIIPKFNSQYNRQRVWRWGANKFELEYKDNLMFCLEDESYYPYGKDYLLDGKIFEKYKDDILGITSDSGTIDFNNLNISANFNFPKPTNLIKYLLRMLPKNDVIVLDFFAGSGTTGQAVLELNQEDFGNRYFILCTNNENNIAEEVTYERIKRVITGYTTPKENEVVGIPSNLKYYTVESLDSSINQLEIEDVLIENIGPFVQFKHTVWEKETVAEDLIALTNESESVYVYSNTLYLCDGFYEAINSSVKPTTLYIYDGLFEFLDEDHLVNVNILSITNEFYKN